MPGRDLSMGRMPFLGVIYALVTDNGLDGESLAKKADVPEATVRRWFATREDRHLASRCLLVKLGGTITLIEEGTSPSIIPAMDPDAERLKLTFKDIRNVFRYSRRAVAPKASEAGIDGRLTADIRARLRGIREVLAKPFPADVGLPGKVIGENLTQAVRRLLEERRSQTIDFNCAPHGLTLVTGLSRPFTTRTIRSREPESFTEHLLKVLAALNLKRELIPVDAA